MSDKLTPLHAVDPSKLEFGEPKKMEGGKQTIIPLSLGISSNAFENRFSFQLNRDEEDMFVCRFGLNKLQDGESEATKEKRTIDVTPTPEAEAKLRAIDARVVEYLHANSKALFNKDTFNKEYKPLVRDSATCGPMVTLRIKVVLPSGPGRDKARLTDVQALDDKNGYYKSSYKCITPGSFVMAGVSAPGIWFNPSQCGIALTAFIMVVKPMHRSSGMGLLNFRSAPVKRAAEESAASTAADSAYEPYEEDEGCDEGYGDGDSREKMARYE